MRGYPLLLEKGAELCTAINISILHKFENTKHKRFGSVGRYVFGVSCICYLVGSNLQLMRNKGILLFNATNHIKRFNI